MASQDSFPATAPPVLNEGSPSITVIPLPTIPQTEQVRNLLPEQGSVGSRPKRASSGTEPRKPAKRPRRLKTRAPGSEGVFDRLESHLKINMLTHLKHMYTDTGDDEAYDKFRRDISHLRSLLTEAADFTRWSQPPSPMPTRIPERMIPFPPPVVSLPHDGGGSSFKLPQAQLPNSAVNRPTSGIPIAPRTDQHMPHHASGSRYPNIYPNPFGPSILIIQGRFSR